MEIPAIAGRYTSSGTLDAAAMSDANLSTLPDPLDGRYRFNANAVSGLTTYTHPDGGERQLAIYHASDRRTHVAERRFPDGEWTRGVDVHEATNSRPLEDDSHNFPAVGVAPDGTVFVVGGHHVDPLAMARSVRPWDASAFVNVPRAAVGTKDTDRVTYPSFAVAAGRLHLSYREQEVGANRQFRWIVKRLDHRRGTWSTLAQLDDSRDTRLYVSGLAVSPDGEEIHLSATWRDEHPSITRGYRQADLFHLWCRDERWYQLGPEEIALGLSFEHPGHSNVPQLVWDTSAGDPEPRYAGSVAVVDEHVHIVNRDRRGRLFHHRAPMTGGWQSRELRIGGEHEALVRVGDRVGLVVVDGDEVRHHALDGSAGHTLARGYNPRRHARVHVDREAMRRGWLSMLMTEFEHGHPGSYEGGSLPREGHVLTVPLAALGTVRPFVKER